MDKEFVSGEDIGKVLDEVEPIFRKHKGPVVFAACLMVAFTVQNPEISAEDLEKGVVGASQWIASYLLQHLPKVPKELLN